MASKTKAKASALERAVRLLAARPQTRSRLREKLEAAGHEAAEVDAALLRMEELSYLNDRAFARDRAESLIARFSPQAVEARLVGFGVEPILARESVAALKADAPALARALLEERFGKGPLEGKAALRAARFLAGRGFDEELIAALLPAHPDDAQ